MPDAEGYDLISELPADGSRAKEVYARFGLAAYAAQVFDHALVNLLVVTRITDRVVTTTMLDDVFDDLFSRTTGKLINLAGLETHLPKDAIALCRMAVKQRNRLIHSFFRDHAEDFMTANGQQLMIDDLAGIMQIIHAADDACQAAMIRVGEAYGFTESRISEEFESMLLRIRSRDQSN